MRINWNCFFYFNGSEIPLKNDLILINDLKDSLRFFKLVLRASKVNLVVKFIASFSHKINNFLQAQTFSKSFQIIKYNDKRNKIYEYINGLWPIKIRKMFLCNLYDRWVFFIL